MGKDSHIWKVSSAVEAGVAIVVLATVAAQAFNVDTALRNLDYNRTTSDADWKAFKEMFKKNYTNPDDDSYRRSVRAKNLELIREHNIEALAGKFHFNLSENSLIDLTVEEYRKLLGYRTWRRINMTTNGTMAFPGRTRRAVYPPAMPTYTTTASLTSQLPTSVNWTAQGWVGPIQNQGQCGSCWSYSAAGSLEAQYKNATGQYVKMSEQNLIDCSGPQGNLGCNGGNVQNAYWYVQTTGIDTLYSYPDTSDKTGKSNPSCSFNATQSVMKAASWREIAQGNEQALQQAVAFVGPVSAAIDAKSLQFQLYSGGVYSNQYCSSTPQSLDHAILVVGYGVYNNQPYWLIKNSWGPTWGIKGYMMLARNSNNMCGIATDATFPVAGWTTTSVNLPSPLPFPSSTPFSIIRQGQGASAGASSTSVTSSMSAIFVFCSSLAAIWRY